MSLAVGTYLPPPGNKSNEQCVLGVPWIALTKQFKRGLFMSGAGIFVRWSLILRGSLVSLMRKVHLNNMFIHRIRCIIFLNS